MNDIFETRIKNYKDREQDDLKIQNFKLLSDPNKDESETIPLTMKKYPLKKSSSYVSLNNIQLGLNLEETSKNSNGFNFTPQTNSVNTSYLFNNNINFTTLNEGSKKNLLSNEKEQNNKSSLPQLYSKNFSNLIKSNDFSPDLGKYDKKIILTLNNKGKELEKKYIRALNYYYQMENIYLSEIKKKGDLEVKLKLGKQI